MKNFRDKFRHRDSQRGFSLMEVLIGIAIFAIGMLALASLQGALTRSTAEAKVRTTAVNIAEQMIEGQRGFAAVLTGGAFSFEDIVDVTSGSPIIFDSEMTRNPDPVVGVTYTVTQDVTDYYYDLATDTFTTTVPTGAVIPDYKTVVVTVAWDDDRNFVIDEDTQTTDNLGGGFVELSATISSISIVTAVQVAEEDNNDIIAPDVSYTPGENPDIVSLSLGDTKFKESLTPEPKVYRDNLETRFDVITYSQSGSGALFLRREEFVAVSCDCTLRAANADNPGYTPTVWAGDEYTEPEPVTKTYGTPAANISQSYLCNTCCRDHHDVSGSALYDPSRPATEYSGGNHKHYSRQGGNFVEAGVGDDYLEACRLVRKDGFFRLGQDFRLEGLNTFPEDYLINTTEVGDYSAYVTGEVYIKDDPTTYVPAAIALDDGYQLDANPPTVDSAPRTAIGDTAAAGDLTLGYTYLPTYIGAGFQQLRSRSIYIDNLSSDLRAVITCIEGKTPTQLETDPRVCDQGDVKLDKTGSYNILELLPFFEVQTTYLNDWAISPSTNSFDVTNEAVSTSDANGPTHSRGLVTNQPADGTDTVHIFANRGVTGISSSDPISAYNVDYKLPTVEDVWPPGDIDVIANTVSPPPVSGRIVTGMLSSEVNGVKAANASITATNATCNFVTTSGVFTCFIPVSINTVTMTVSGFDKPPKTIYLCSSHQFGAPAEMPVNAPTNASDPKDVDLTNALAVPVNPATPYSLVLTEDACPTGGLGG
ncbi:MAG: prepilin-type N-terminal cleavage/methylation domain-containing protein [Gammaproteobacteria bacterium]|nr:prepilin-type N-terminal cleavage/methylation domain-containing protein [Gammaproteobacteria bacterium]